MAEFKPGMECVPGNMKEEDGKVYLCNKRGKWKKAGKKHIDPAAQSLQENIDRLFSNK